MYQSQPKDLFAAVKPTGLVRPKKEYLNFFRDTGAKRDILIEEDGVFDYIVCSSILENKYSFLIDLYVEYSPLRVESYAPECIIQDQRVVEKDFFAQSFAVIQNMFENHHKSVIDLNSIHGEENKERELFLFMSGLSMARREQYNQLQNAK